SSPVETLMPTGVPLLGSVAAGLLEHGSEVLAGQLPEPSVLADIARHAQALWDQGRDPGQTRAELAALAQASPEEVRRQVEEAVEKTAAGRPTSVRAALADYLHQVPSTIQRSLGRLDESCGPSFPPLETIPPDEALLPFLPTARPLFRAGARPPCL